jgi:hypothetical protein
MAVAMEIVVSSNAPALPDPMLGDPEGGIPTDSTEEAKGAATSNKTAGKQVCTHCLFV